MAGKKVAKKAPVKKAPAKKVTAKKGAPTPKRPPTPAKKGGFTFASIANRPQPQLEHVGDPSTHIAIIHDAFAEGVISRAFKWFQEASSTLAVVGLTVGGYDPNVKVTSDVDLTSFSNKAHQTDRADRLQKQAMQLDADIGVGVGIAITTYGTTYPRLGGGDWDDSGYMMQHYACGEGFYGPHVDSSPNVVPTRVLSMVIYLNDVVTGGETHFPLFGLKVKPCAGDIVVFPSNWCYVHEGLIPVSSDKAIISTFIEHKNRKDHVH